MQSLRQYARMAGVAILVAIICVTGFLYVPFLKVAENWLGDLRVATLTSHVPQSEQIVLLTINEDTLAALPYRSPIDRGLLFQVVRELERRQVALIGLDILFDQPTESSKDQQLFAALRELKVPLVVAWAEQQDGLTEKQAAFLEESLRHLQHGLALVEEDRFDGKVRAVLLRRHQNGAEVLGFSAALASAVGAVVSDRQTLQLRYRRGPDPDTSTFKTYPMHLLPVLPADWFKNKLVLIGVDLPLEDRHKTPMSIGLARTMPGVEIHAHGLVQLLDGLSGYGIGRRYVLGVILAFSVAGVLAAMGRLALWLKGVIGLTFLSAAWVGAFLIFQRGQVLLPIVLPSIAFALSMSIEVGFKWQREARQRRFVLNAFGKYLAPSVIEQLVADPARLRLAGEKKEMTFLFSDIAGFTGLTEQTEPAVLVASLNDYLALVTGVVLRHEGTIDKIVGDALHVMFNSPVDQIDHAERATRCGLEMDAQCQEFCRKSREAGVPFGETRIGINTGEAVVGNFGGADRFDYTAHGDAINTAARLESVNKHFGTRICTSETTVRRCNDILFRPVARLVLKGKITSVKVFQPLGRSDEKIPQLAEYLRGFKLLDNNHASTPEVFAALLKKYPDDPVILFHAERLALGDTGSTIVMSEK